MIIIPVAVRLRNQRQLGMILAAIGGLLISVEGAFLIGDSSNLYPDFAILRGLAIAGSAVLADARSRGRIAFGAAALVLSLISFPTISGYLIGAVLGTLGASLILTSPGIHLERLGRGAPPPKLDLGSPCGSCGRDVPSWTKSCPYCGTSN